MEQGEHEGEVERRRLEIVSAYKSGREFSIEDIDASSELWKDREVITAACHQFPGNIEKASPELRADENFIVGLAKSIDFSKFPNYGVGGKGVSVFAQDAGFNMVDVLRIQKEVSGS